MSAVAISVVIPIRMAQHTIVSTLEDLLRKCADLPAEVIAVVSEKDPTSDLIRRWAHPHLRVIVCPGRSSIPQLRREGVLASEAGFIAISEDHCLFPERWVERQMQILSSSDVHVCGGPVDNGRHSWAGWAQYFTRYCAFLPPGREGPTRLLPGNNACYRGSLLRENADLLEDGFWEAELNHELLRRQYKFWYAPDLSVCQRQERGPLEYAGLRYRHGRCFSARKMQAASLSTRLVGILKSPLVPFVLYLRGARAVSGSRPYLSRFLAATPLLLFYYAAWSVGECVGWMFGGGCVDTD